MPNHIINTIRLTGDREKISELLESVKDNRFGIGSLDFNKVIPMPESLQIETSSSMERGLKAYKEFVDICTFDGANKDIDNGVIAKLHTNKPLTSDDIKALEGILWSELGTKEEYEKEYQDILYRGFALWSCQCDCF